MECKHAPDSVIRQREKAFPNACPSRKILFKFPCDCGLVSDTHLVDCPYRITYTGCEFRIANDEPRVYTNSDASNAYWYKLHEGL